ncbi:MAG: hypothetical protein V7776_02140 [Halopseudomonas aestusnigri]
MGAVFSFTTLKVVSDHQCYWVYIEQGYNISDQKYLDHKSKFQEGMGIFEDDNIPGPTQ